VALVCRYDGTDFAGWQAQAARRTVQGTLEEAVSRLARHAAVVHGAGRTDAGVHAAAQVAHVDVPPAAAPALGRRLNALLPPDLRIWGAAPVEPAFHARRCAVSKAYRYRLRLAPTDDPLTRRFRHHVAWRVDLERLREATARFVGERDFRALQTAGSSVETTVRSIARCEAAGEPPEIDVLVEGTGFLRHMVRALVGCLLDVGRGRREPGWIDGVLAGADRADAAPNAPAHGLQLESITYPEPWASRLREAVRAGLGPIDQETS
jgi:tRNA pseudouridine38-40 synthase